MPGKKVISLEVDAALNAAYLRFTDDPIDSTVEVTADVQVDVDPTGAIVGVEILDLAAEISARVIGAQFSLRQDQEAAIRQARSALSAFATTTSSQPGTAALCS
jgi:uncharacterized protein YuzE